MIHAIAAGFVAALLVLAAPPPSTIEAAPQRSTAIPAMPRHETPHLSITTSATPVRVTPGSRVSLLIDVAPKPKMHVYSPEQKDMIPISLALDAGAFTVQRLVFPKPQQYFFKPLNETQFVYSEPFRLRQDITIARTPTRLKHTPEGGSPLTITGTLRYQACDDAICYLPVSVAVRWELSTGR